MWNKNDSLELSSKYVEFVLSVHDNLNLIEWWCLFRKSKSKLWSCNSSSEGLFFICLSPRKLVIDPSYFDALKSAKLGVLESQQRSRTIWREILDVYKGHESKGSTPNFLDSSKYF